MDDMGEGTRGGFSKWGSKGRCVKPLVRNAVRLKKKRSKGKKVLRFKRGRAGQRVRFARDGLLSKSRCKMHYNPS